MKYAYTSSLMVTPCGKELGGKLFIRIVKKNHEGSCHILICSLMLGISKNISPAVSFVICCYFVTYIMMPKMRQILQCNNTSNLLRRDVWSANILHSHGSSFVKMVRKMSYFL